MYYDNPITPFHSFQYLPSNSHKINITNTTVEVRGTIKWLGRKVDFFLVFLYVGSTYCTIAVYHHNSNVCLNILWLRNTVKLHVTLIPEFSDLIG